MRTDRILIVDDEKSVRSAIGGVLEDEGFEVAFAESGEECLSLVEREQFAAILLDVWLPEMDGLETLTRLRAMEVGCSVIMISGHATIETAVKAAKAGAFDFIEKPLSSDKTILVIKNALKQKSLEEEVRSLRERMTARHTLIGESDAVKQLRADIALAAPSNGRVFIYGDNGTGKELVAHLIHSQSLRARKPFVEMNCAAVPEELIESKLFGHEKGSFTGAHEAKKGKFELADEGTLFLDEIGDMSLRMQAKVLRVLQEQTFQPVGGTRTIKVNVRVLAATNKDVQQEILAGTFREDLFFRLNVLPFTLAPLRERRTDIPLLVNHFVEQLAREYGKKPKLIADDAMRLLQSYPWPGNVRELKNVIEHMMIMVPAERVNVADLPTQVRGGDAGKGNLFDDFKTLREARESFEKRFIQRKLEQNGWNITRTADVLGLERSNLHRKLKAYSLSSERGERQSDG